MTDIGQQGFNHNAFSRALAAAIIILLLSGASFHRNKAWFTLLSLWQDCAAKSPLKSRSHNNLGNCNMLLKRYFTAIEEYNKAIALDAGNIEAYYNAAMSLELVGFAAQAAPYYDYFCKNAPPAYDEQKKRACTYGESFSRERAVKRRQ